MFKVYAMHKMQLDVERENREYAYQVQYYDKQIKDRQAMIQEVRRTRHDMKNNMIYLKELLNTDAEKAREFLMERKYKIYEIADKTGYTSSRYFTDAFKKRFGSSPGDYILRLNGESEV